MTLDEEISPLKKAHVVMEDLLDVVNDDAIFVLSAKTS